MSFYMKLTAAGAAKIAAASLTGGEPVLLTEIAVGDGDGDPVPAPLGTETELVNEVFRAEISALVITPGDDTAFTAEMIIPTDEGGWDVHEIGIFDDEGELFAYGNFPATHKPIAVEGATREMIIRAVVKVASAALVALTVDAAIVLATRAWVIANYTAASIIPGGITDQILAKASEDDGDVQWVDRTDYVELFFMAQL